MSETQFLLRLNAPGTKELKTTAVDVFGSAQEFTSQLTSGYTRKYFRAFNNSHSSSGEIVWGPLGVTGQTGMIIAKDAVVEMPLSVDVPVYFCNTVSGEIGNLRVVEIA